jgi:hypothetical protein
VFNNPALIQALIQLPRMGNVGYKAMSPTPQAAEEQRLLNAYQGRRAELQDIFNRLPQNDVRNRELLQRVLAQL